jgi:hypothetical protein
MFRVRGDPDLRRAYMPVMNERQQRLLDEKRSYPPCPTCATQLVSNPAYMRNMSGDVRVTLICPNRDDPHPDGNEVAEMFLRPDEVRKLGL